MRVICPDVGGGFGTKLFPYREYALIAVAAKKLRKTDQMDRRSLRSFHGRRAGPRQRHDGADGAGRGRQVPRHGRRPDRRHGRVSVDLRPLHSPWRRRHAARPLRHPGLPLPGPHRVHQHRAGRRLSRRRTARGRLCGRAAGRCCGAKTRHGAGCDPAQEFHRAAGDALQDRDRQGLRLRRLHRAYEAGDGGRQLEGISQARQGREEAGSGARHRAWHLCRGLRHHGRGDRQCGARSQWRRLDPDRHAIERAGPPDRLCADRRRAVRPDAGPRPHPAGRHRQDRDRPRHRRLGLDPDRRRLRRTRHPHARGRICGRSPPRRWKPAPAISRSATASFGSPAPTARSPLRISPSGRASIRRS